MADCERQTEVAAPVDAVLAYVRDPQNLRRFVPGVKDADRTFGGGVDVVTGAEGSERRTEAELSADPSRHRVEWAVEGPEGYGGHLNVLPGDHGSVLRATVHSERLPAEDLTAAMDDVLARIKQAVEQERRTPDTSA